MTTIQSSSGIQAGELRWYGAHLMQFLVTSEQTNGAFSLIKTWLRHGNNPPMHIHEYEDELVHIQEGSIRFTIGDRVIDAKAGDTIFLPRQIPHTFEVTTPTAKTLLYLTPGAFEGFFYELSKEAPEAVLPPAPMGPPPANLLQAITATSARYGVYNV